MPIVQQRNNLPLYGRCYQAKLPGVPLRKVELEMSNKAASVISHRHEVVSDRFVLLPER